MTTAIKVTLLIITIVMAFSVESSKDKDEQFNLLVAFCTSVIALVVLQIYVK